MFKKIIAVITGILAIVGGALFLRRDSNRSGIRNDIDRAGRISKGTGELGEVNQEIGNGIDRAQEITDDIKQDNKTSGDGVRSAIEILKNAKRRSTDT